MGSLNSGKLGQKNLKFEEATEKVEAGKIEEAEIEKTPGEEREGRLKERYIQEKERQ